MKKYLCLIAMLAAATVLGVFADDAKTREWGAVTCNAQMSIELKESKSEIQSNQSVYLVIRIKNVSTNDTIGVYQSLAIVVNSLVNFSFVVISPSGKDVSPKAAEYFRGGSAGSYSIGPGQIKTFDYDLNYLCKFDEVGTYKVTAKKRLFPDLEEKCELVSNSLNIVVSK